MDTINTGPPPSTEPQLLYTFSGDPAAGPGYLHYPPSSDAGLQNGYRHPVDLQQVDLGPPPSFNFASPMSLPQTNYSTAVMGQHHHPQIPLASQVPMMHKFVKDSQTFRYATSQPLPSDLMPQIPGDSRGVYQGQTELQFAESGNRVVGSSRNIYDNDVHDYGNLRQSLATTSRNEFRLGSGTTMMPYSSPNSQPDNSMISNLSNPSTLPLVVSVEGLNVTQTTGPVRRQSTSQELMMVNNEQNSNPLQTSVIMHTGDVSPPAAKPTGNYYSKKTSQSNLKYEQDDVEMCAFQFQAKPRPPRNIVVDNRRAVPIPSDAAPMNPVMIQQPATQQQQFDARMHIASNESAVNYGGDHNNPHFWNGGTNENHIINDAHSNFPTSSRAQNFDSPYPTTAPPQVSPLFNHHQNYNHNQQQFAPVTQPVSKVDLNIPQEHSSTQVNHTGDQIQFDSFPPVNRGRGRGGRSPRGSGRGRGAGGGGRSRKQQLPSQNLDDLPVEISAMPVTTRPKSAGRGGRKKQAGTPTGEQGAESSNLQTGSPVRKPRSPKKAIAQSLDGEGSTMPKKPRTPKQDKSEKAVPSPDITAGFPPAQAAGQSTPTSGRGSRGGRGRGRNPSLVNTSRRKSAQKNVLTQSQFDETTLRVTANFANIAGNIAAKGNVQPPYCDRVLPSMASSQIGPMNVVPNQQPSPVAANANPPGPGQVLYCNVPQNFGQPNVELARVPIISPGQVTGPMHHVPNYVAVSSNQFSGNFARSDAGGTMPGPQNNSIMVVDSPGVNSGGDDQFSSRKRSTAKRTRYNADCYGSDSYDEDDLYDDDGVKIPRTTRSRARQQRSASASNDSNSQAEFTRNEIEASKQVMVEGMQMEADFSDEEVNTHPSKDQSVSVQPSSLPTTETEVNETITEEPQPGTSKAAAAALAAVKKPRVVRRPVNRALTLPKVPMRESRLVNIPERTVKKGKGRKTLERENFLSDEEYPEMSQNRHNVDVSGGKTVSPRHIVPEYTPKEKDMLYADGEFVIDVNDVDKKPDQIFIWQIIEEECCLSQYYPAKYGEKQFFVSSCVKWFFPEEEFRGVEFYARFQPIVVVLASEGKPLCVSETSKPKKLMTEKVFQYLYVDKPFFCRMTKLIGKIRGIEALKRDFMRCFPIMTMLTLHPDFLENIYANFGTGVPRIGRFDLIAWNQINKFQEQIIQLMLQKAREKYMFNEDALKMLLEQPTFRCLTTGVNKEAVCFACRSKDKLPHFRVYFRERGEVTKRPYDIRTMKEYTPDHTPIPAQAFFGCKTCTLYAKKFHKLIHFRHNLLRLVKQNTLFDIEVSKRYYTAVTDEYLVWTQDHLIGWRNVMFLEFQLTVGEIMDEVFIQSEGEAH